MNNSGFILLKAAPHVLEMLGAKVVARNCGNFSEIAANLLVDPRANFICYSKFPDDPRVWIWPVQS